MARKSKVEAGESQPVEGGKSKGNLVPAVVVAVGLVAGGFLMGGRSAPPSAASSSGGEATSSTDGHGEEEAAKEPGDVLTLDTITLNLADGSYLKVGLALQLAKGVDPAGGGGHGGGGDPKAYAAQALDEAIAVLGGHTFDELVSPDGREAAKKALSERIGERYHGDVIGVYFTEFVMQ